MVVVSAANIDVVILPGVEPQHRIFPIMTLTWLQNWKPLPLVRLGELQGNTHGEYTTSNLKRHSQIPGQFFNQRFSTHLPVDSDTDSTFLEHLERFSSYYSQTLLLMLLFSKLFFP